MPIPLPPPGARRRYRHRTGAGAEGQIQVGDALRAFADDLLETGDPRLALDRAFRWGYRDEAGQHVAGLQEHLQELRHRRERLRRQAEQERFLEALAPELDRIDALDGRDPDADATPLERLADYADAGCRTAPAQERLDALIDAMRAAASSEPRGAGTAPSGRGHLRAGRDATLDRVRRMLFEGGEPSVGPSRAGGWRRDLQEATREATLDLALLGELDAVEASLSRLEHVGGVVALGESGMPEETGNPDIDAWLDGWREAMRAVMETPAGTQAQPRVALPPEVIAAISRDLLKGLFRSTASPIAGEHEARERGTAGDVADTTVPWEAGRPLDLDLVATVSSAVRRGAAASGSVTLRPDDFAVRERNAPASVATVLAIDRSRSMGQSGAWTAARKVALAMHELIRQSYPRDSLAVLAFSSSAEPVAIVDVPTMPWDRYEHGTDLQGALAQARELLRRNRAGTRQVVVITDGEPTLARIQGEEVFASPPTAEILEATMREVIRCTREGITINLVMLGASENAFAEQVARVNRGRIFVATKESLGSFLLRDYMSR